ncbi:MAG: DUF350 domain-containing protein [Bacteroidota bacterium]
MNLTAILANFSFLILYVVLFFLSKWIKGMFASYVLDEQLTEYDNNAVSVSVAGYFIGITAVFVGAMSGPSAGDVVTDLISVASYSLAGILLLNLARIINSRLILYKFNVDKEIIKDQNPGTGVVEAGAYIASGLIIAGAIHGEGGGPLTALVFYIIGQICLILFSLLYARMSPYDVHAEIEKDNTAAGLGFAGALISIGIIVMKGVSGDFTGWAEDLMALGIDIAIIFVYLIVVRLVFDRFVLRNSSLHEEISEDQNMGAGLLEMMVAICFSAALFFVL